MPVKTDEKKYVEQKEEKEASFFPSVV